MFYFLSKTIDFLVMPFSICLLLLMYSVVSKKMKGKRSAVISAIVLLFVISNSYLVNKAFLWWEPQPTNIGDTAEYDVGVVLSGGMINARKLSSDHVELGNHANRFYNAFLLYKSGKIKKILITGTSPPAWIAAGKGESGQAAKILIDWGVAANDVLIEEKARNTRENALFSAKILTAKFPGKKVLILTSAFHVRRAMGCFQKAGVKADYFPTDFYGIAHLNRLKDIFIPDSDYIGHFNLLWHEWIGYVTYLIMGYC